ncbi:MAG: glycosyltransferase family 2 protein, partial [Solirubrobacteraceae bacterium]
MLIIAIPVVGAAVALSYAALNARRRRHREILPTSYSERMRATRAAERPTVSAVVPALNEEHGIGWVVEHIPSWVTEVVLVDGLSTDLTEALAQRIKPDLRVVHQHKRGKGAALRAGFAAAQAEIVVMLDADGSTDPAEIERFVDALVQGADFVKGSREVDGGGSEDFTLLRRAGNRGYVWLVNLLF